MSAAVLAARARGLSTRVMSPAMLGGFDAVTDRASLAAACATAGLTIEPTTRAIESFVRARMAADLATLDRWADRDVLDAILYDEDRRTLRVLARSLAANIAPSVRLASSLPTATLPARMLGALANTASFADIAKLLGKHPLAPAFGESDLFGVELQLSRRYVALANRASGALATYVAQMIDGENASAALLLSARPGDVDPQSVFLDGGRELDRATFLRAYASPDTAREQLARAFDGTPVAKALFASGLEDAVLAWQIATQARLRRLEPLGLAPTMFFVLRRRDEVRRLRRAAWRVALRGAA